MAASWMRLQEELKITGHNKLKLIQLIKLNLARHEKLRFARPNKLTKAQELWQVHIKNWSNPLML